MTSGADPARVPLLLFDTHTLIWFMFGDRRLGEVAAESILDACRNDFALVSAITPWEIGLLVSKRRIELFRDLTEWILEVLSTPGVRLAQLEPEIAIASTRLPFEMHTDPADRILVATARRLGATLVTADGELLELAGKGHFRALDAAK